METSKSKTIEKRLTAESFEKAAAQQSQNQSSQKTQQPEEEKEDWYSQLLYMAHWFPNSSIFDINKITLQQFIQARKVMKRMMQDRNPVTNMRDAVNRSMEELLENPEKVKELLDS